MAGKGSKRPTCRAKPKQENFNPSYFHQFNKKIVGINQ